MMIALLYFAVALHFSFVQSATLRYPSGAFTLALALYKHGDGVALLDYWRGWDGGVDCVHGRGWGMENTGVGVYTLLVCANSTTYI